MQGVGKPSSAGERGKRTEWSKGVLGVVEAPEEKRLCLGEMGDHLTNSVSSQDRTGNIPLTAQEELFPLANPFATMRDEVLPRPQLA